MVEIVGCDHFDCGHKKGRVTRRTCDTPLNAAGSDANPVDEFTMFCDKGNSCQAPQHVDRAAGFVAAVRLICE